jgi:hypothetical protein
MNMNSKPGDVWDEVLGWCTPSERETRRSSCTSRSACWVAEHPDKCRWKNERDQLLEMTRMLDEHPEGYDGPCACKLCCSYGD